MEWLKAKKPRTQCGAFLSYENKLSHPYPKQQSRKLKQFPTHCLKQMITGTKLDQMVIFYTTASSKVLFSSANGQYYPVNGLQ